MHDGWLAFYIAIVWHYEIDADKAYRVLYSQSKRFKKQKKELPKETIVEIKYIIESKKNWKDVESKYCMDRYKIADCIAQM